MIRRALLVAAAAVALTIAPSTAMAYNAPGYDCTVSDSTPTTGVAFTADAAGVKTGDAVTLTTTGNPTLTEKGTATGAAFTVTLDGAGTHSLVVTNAAGEVICTQSVTVGGVEAAAGPELANTGAQGLNRVVGGGVALVLVGAGAMVVARRRKSERVEA